MAKYTLTLEDDFNFDLIGICSHQQDYRIAWAINSALELHLTKSDTPFMVSGKKGAVLSSHSMYEFEDEQNGVVYYLIQNKNDGKLLLPECAQIDYFIVVREAGVIDVDKFLESIKDITAVLTAFIYEPETLKSANRLIF